MKLTPKISLLLVVALVVPTVGMGLAGRHALGDIERAAGQAAIEASVAAERGRLDQLVVRRSQSLDSLLGRVQLDVEHLREDFDGGYAETQPVVAKDDLYDVPGWPGYGRIDPTLGVYADFERKGQASPWMPRQAVARGRADPVARARLSTLLRRAVALSPALEAVHGRYPGLVDLAWIVMTEGPTNAWPPYDYRVTIAQNPGIVDLDESGQDYVRLVSPTEDPSRRVRWTEPYRDAFKGRWMTSVVVPVYDGDTFLGSVGADLLLSSLIAEALTTPAGPGSYAALLGPTHAPLATTRQGVEELVGDPDLRAALLAAMSDEATPSWSPELVERLRQMRLDESTDPSLREVARACDEDGPIEVSVAGTPRLVACSRISTPGWTLVAVVPVEAAAERTASVRSVLAAGKSAVEREYAWYALTVLLLTTAAGLLVHRIAVRPITALAARVESLSPEDLALPEDAPRADEIGSLRRRIGELLDLVRTGRDRLRDERERLASTLRGIGDAVVATDRDGLIHLANPVAEAFVGGTLVGQPIGEALPLIAEGTGRPIEDPVRRVLAADQVISFSERLELRPRGAGARAVTLTGAPVRTADGTVSGAVLVLRDVTEARRVEEGLARIQKLETVQVLAAGIAHDFNNLLAGIAGYTSLAAILIPPDSPAQDKLNKADRAIERGRGLTAQLLTFSRGGDPMRSRVDPRALLKDATGLALRGLGGRCDWDVPDDLWAVHADPAQLGQVIQNLVINANQAMPNGGKLEIRARNVEASPGPLAAGRYVEFAVRDEGVGIPAENLARIFDPFFTTKPQGTGLGLAVCFSIVQKHGGHIEASSTPGRGTTFRFWLPAYDRDQDDDGDEHSLPPGGCVLILDDDATFRTVLTEMVRALGLGVVAVGSGQEALQALERQKFALLIFDLTLPGGPGGVETLATARQRGVTTPAVVSSGYSDDDALAEPARYGFSGALRKPFDLPMLRAELRRVVG